MTRLIYKILANTATDDERILFRKWIKESVEHQERYESLKLIWSSGNKFPEATEEDVLEESFQKVKQKVQRRVKQKRRRHMIAIGAVAVALAFFLLYFKTSRSSNYLAFHNEPVSTVIESIESKYHIEIDIENKSILPCPFTGTFYEVDLPSHLVASIADALGAQYEKVSAREYRLVGGRCR